MPAKGAGPRQKQILLLLGDGKPRWQGDIAVETGSAMASVHNVLKLMEVDKQIVSELQHPERPPSKTNRRMYRLAQ